MDMQQEGHQQDPRRRSRPRKSSLARYAFAWIAVGALMVMGIGALIRALGGEEDVPLPPVRAIEVNDAALEARCRLVRPVEAEQLNPPVDGPPGQRRVRPGYFDEPLPPAQLGAAVRQGLVVIHFRPDVSPEVREDLRDLQRAVPDGTIVAINEGLGRAQIAVTAYRRLLECPRYTRDAIDAIRLFRGRFIGTGPERPRTPQ